MINRWDYLSSLVVVTGKVPRELKEKAKKLGININKVIREALESAVRKREEELFMESLDRCADILSKIDIERTTKSIRENRESR